MNRKEFLKSTAALGVNSLILPSNFLSSWLEEDPMIKGQGNKRYKMNSSWCQASTVSTPVNDCHEMVLDSKNRLILLTNETQNNVIFFDRSGKVLHAWGKEYPGAHGLTLFDENGSEVLFICDYLRHEVIKTTLDGKVLMVIPYPKETGEYSKKEEFKPTETAISPNGDIYIADGYGKDFVIQYDSTGKYIRHFGGRGKHDGNLLNAHGITVDYRQKEPILMVTSRMQHCFKTYTMDGKYLDTIFVNGAQVCRPVIKGDYVYSAALKDSLLGRGFVVILDKNNQVVSCVDGTAPEYVNGQLSKKIKAEKTWFTHPHDVCIDNDENIYVAQWNSKKVYPYQLIPV
ncbi:MAG: 6-bladed beta-propeller [Flavobacteriaceae bacterium]|nr:MAG: 6-bladed beta-propeller [Flavobacteriaceae bacterium]